MRRLFVVLATIYVTSFSGQTTIDFEEDTYAVTKGAAVLYSMCMTPDQTELAVTTGGGGLLFLDPKTLEPTRSYDIAGMGQGARIRFTPSGRYMVLQEIRLQDWNINKDNKQTMWIVDVASGEVLIKRSDVYDMALSPLEDSFAYMEKGKLVLRSFPDKKEIASYSDERLGSSITFSRDGQVLYASRGFDKKDLKSDPRFKKDRQGRKAFSKYQQTVVGYDVSALVQVSISEDNFDEIYALQVNKTGDRLLIYAKQDEKVNATYSTNFVLQMDLASGRLLREQFNSRLADPDYKENEALGLFGITTNEDMDRSGSVILYVTETNEIMARFDVDARFFGGIKEGRTEHGQASFEFSPDGRYLMVGIGNYIHVWSIQEVE